MPNELLWIIFLIFDLAMVIAAYRLWGRIGLYAMIAGSVIICNIQVVVVIEMFGLTATLGNIVYASIFLATDILSENYGKREARKGIWIGFFCLFWMIAAMQFAIQFKPSGFDRMMPHLTEIFSFLPRIAVASLAAYLISQHHDVWAFHQLKARTGGRLLWLRNNLSTAVSQLLDSVAFTMIAFYGMFPASELFQIVVTTYLFKVIVAALDTPFLYLARKIKTAVPGGEGKLI